MLRIHTERLFNKCQWTSHRPRNWTDAMAKDPSLSPVSKTILLALDTHIHTTGNHLISQPDLVEWTGVSKTTLGKWTKELIESGWLEVTRPDSHLYKYEIWYKLR